ncbi:hypothetical protein GJ744_009703 [Endocarpon pusillum]|uniref:Protein kinase domain-containing protein n=1 Tax=Endocarpon pusillum TaxID=364733 RepID=A0A8H7E8L3_9EURO|nr:hypothetical protein GJ744_009703 [Endocarpon pusillum]
MISGQHVVRDAVVSNKHLRIYTIIFDDDHPDGIAPLVYAEDLSRNGTYWNGSLIGKGNAGVLLSDGDTLRISPRIYYHFRQSTRQEAERQFDLTQECEMKHFEKEYNVSDRKLGSGACGAVFMAIEQSRRTQLACKIVDLRRLGVAPRTQTSRCETAAATEEVDSRAQMAKIKLWAERKQNEYHLEQQLKAYYREASILATLSHPNIIGIEKVYITDNSIYIFQDLITGGDLFSFLERKNGKLSEVEAAVIVRQIVIALEYLHEQNIVHRDLKPENILMTSLANGCRVVLTDFGHSKKVENDRTRMTTMAGTEQYIAPEISGFSRHFKGKNGYTKAIDMWSLGCVTVVLLTGGSPFINPKTNQYCQQLAQECSLQQLECVTEWQFVGKRPKDFVRRLLVLDEEQRMTPSDAKRHCWFSNDSHRLDFEAVYQRAIQHWRPRTLKPPVIDMINVHHSTEQSVLQKSDLGQRISCRKTPVPVDPPYKPYPRRMNFLLLSKRRPVLSGVMSEEVRIAIAEKWSPGKMRGRAPDPEEDKVSALVPCGLSQCSETRNDQALTDKSEGSEGFAHTTNPATAEAPAPHCGDDATVLDEVTFNQGSEDVAAKSPPGLAMHDAGEKPKPSLNVKGGGQNPFTSTLSIREDLNFLPANHTKPFTYQAAEASKGESSLTKLQRPLRSLNMRFKQTSKSKRRRGSIYDIDSDDESEQAHCGLSTFRANPEGGSVRIGTVWKKARTSMHEREH